MPDQPELRQRLAEELKGHRWVSFDMSWDACGGCTWRGISRDEHFEHIADVLLALPGIAIVPLPLPDDDHHDDIAFWWQGVDVGVQSDTVSVRFDCAGEVAWLSPDVARKTAAALLAAAGVAEEQTNA